MTMGHTLSCVVSLFLLVYGGPAKGDEMLTLEPNFSPFYIGESATFKCNVKGNKTNWDFKFTRNGQRLHSSNNHELNLHSLTPDMSGEYQCVGRPRGPTDAATHSNTVTLTVAAHRPKAKITADRKTLPPGGSLTLSCSVDGSAGWMFWFTHATTQSMQSFISNFTNIYSPGTCWCGASRGNPHYVTEDSDVFRIEMSLSNRAVVKFQNRTKSSPVFFGETITLMCEIEGGGDIEWEYEWRSTTSYTFPPDREYRIKSVSHSHYGNYYCKGRKNSSSSTEWSEAFSFSVTPRPTVYLRSRWRTEPYGEIATLTCTVNDNYYQWRHSYYYWFKYSPDFSQSHMINNGGPDTTINVSEGGVYFCRGGTGDPVVFTEDSNAVVIEKQVSIKPSLSVHPKWLVMFNGEVVSFHCWASGGPDQKWTYELSTPNSETITASGGDWDIIASETTRGIYRCLGYDQYTRTQWSDPVTLITCAPKVSLSSDTGTLQSGGRVTLTCSVTPSSSEWRFYWYRGKKTSILQTMHSFVSSISEDGLYWCRGGRGNPEYYTEYSNPVSIARTVRSTAAVRLQHGWPCIHYEEAETIRCDIEDGGDAEWEYDWETTSSQPAPNQRAFAISYKSDNVIYWCKGRMKSAQHVSTGWSTAFLIPKCYDIPEPVLTVSQSWLSPGDSVTLTCLDLESSGGWRFYWYKAVPKLKNVRDYPYRFNNFRGDMTRVEYHVYELLPGSANGTTQNFYIVRGQTHTAGYFCRGGRGDPVYYTEYSEPVFVWSGDLQSSPSLKVIPDRAQHFSRDYVSLSCEGNSTEWRVMWTGYDSLSTCFNGGFMTGSICKFTSDFYRHGLYWCESGSGEFSNAVNITISVDMCILLSPVHSVNEGDSVTLGCKLKTGNISTIAFYKDDKLIQNNHRQELNISAVSKSDEGFYKCESSGFQSQPSWVAVRSVSKSSFPSSMTIGLICAAVLVLLLPMLVLCWYKKSKDICCNRSADVASVQPVNQDENQQQLYSSLLHGDLSIYESVAGSRNNDGEHQGEYRNDASQIQRKRTGQTRP